MEGNGQLSVPPGFRFHPTDEELLYYYLRKKVSFEAIDLDVIREIDLNKLEPWDLKEKCRIGTGPQNEWYFFSHKDKKYPTGTRTNRATAAGFWKATGRDKAIHLNNSKRIGMRKTLVFYTGRAPHGQKTDWIMHEYRLDDDHSELHPHQLQEDGWVVCRVFKKKNQSRGYLPDAMEMSHTKPTHHGTYNNQPLSDPKHYMHPHLHDYSLGGGSNMHLPQLFSPESAVPPSFISPAAASMDLMECSQSLLRLTAAGGSSSGSLPGDKFHGDWLFLDKLLTSHQQCLDNQHNSSQNGNPNAKYGVGTSSSHEKFPFPYFGGDISRFPK